MVMPYNIALEQPSQQPVAWIRYGWQEIGGEKFQITDIREFDNGGVPLYTHPAPSWQGLSDDEIDCLEHNDFTCWGRDDLIVFGRAIEQALKEKNT